MNKIPYIHLFKASGMCFVYDVNKNSLLKIKEKMFRNLKKIKQGIEIKDYDIEKIQELGFLKSNRCLTIRHSDDYYLEDLLNNKVYNIILQVTKKCNFRCNYCIYSEKYTNRTHENKSMTLKTAKKALDFLLNQSKDSESVQIGFYGGEPLIEFDLIKKCIQYSKKIFEGKTVNYNLTTNGSLLTKEVVEYFSRYNVKIVISIDGPKEIHDKNRKYYNSNKSTHDTIIKNIHNIYENFPEYIKNIMINTVKDEESDIKDVISYFSNSDIFKDRPLLIADVSNENRIEKINYKKEHFNNLEYEKFKYILNITNRMYSDGNIELYDELFGDIRRVKQTLKIKQNLIKEVSHPSGPCVPGVTKFLVDVMGKFFLCDNVNEKSESLKIGNLEDGFDIEKIRNLINPAKITEEACKNCYAFIYCNQCVLHSIQTDEYSDGLSTEKRLMKCIITKKELEENFKDICVINELYNNWYHKNV